MMRLLFSRFCMKEDVKMIKLYLWGDVSILYG